MAVRLVTAPGTEPITLTEAKAHLRLEESFDDTTVTALIVAARQYIEKVCWRGLISQTWELSLPSFRGIDKFEELQPYVAGTPQPYPFQSNRVQPYLELPKGHLAETPAVSIVYLDVNGASQTLSALNYVVEGGGVGGIESQNGRVWLNIAGGYAWPNTLDRFDAVKVTYTVGWLNAAKVPGPLKQAMLLLISQMYEYRSPELTLQTYPLKFAVDALIATYTLKGL